MTRLALTISLAALGAAGALAGAVPVYAHHAFAASYVEEQSVTIEGEVVELDYQNPHAWVHVSAPDGSGRMQKYGAEWANPGRLASRGSERHAQAGRSCDRDRQPVARSRQLPAPPEANRAAGRRVEVGGPESGPLAAQVRDRLRTVRQHAQRRRRAGAAHRVAHRGADVVDRLKVGGADRVRRRGRRSSPCTVAFSCICAWICTCHWSGVE